MESYPSNNNTSITKMFEDKVKNLGLTPTTNEDLKHTIDLGFLCAYDAFRRIADHLYHHQEDFKLDSFSSVRDAWKPFVCWHNKFPDEDVLHHLPRELMDLYMKSKTNIRLGQGQRGARFDEWKNLLDKIERFQESVIPSQ